LPDRKPFSIYEKPTPEEALKNVREAISGRKTLILIGNCWVEYRGRASSKLEPGERIVIIKEDGSVLVHRPKGYEPVNWQPPGCLFQTYKDNEVLVIKAVRRRPSEAIMIYFDRLYILSILNLIDEGIFSLYASEEDMQRAILLQPSIVEKGLKPITYEKKVEPGFIDVYGIDKDGKLVVIEIKRITAGREVALQLSRYVKSVKAIVNREVRGILVAPEIAKGVQKLLVTLGLEFRPLNPKKCAEILRRHETRKLAEFFEA